MQSKDEDLGSSKLTRTKKTGSYNTLTTHITHTRTTSHYTTHNTLNNNEGEQYHTIEHYESEILKDKGIQTDASHSTLSCHVSVVVEEWHHCNDKHTCGVWCVPRSLYNKKNFNAKFVVCRQYSP